MKIEDLIRELRLNPDKVYKYKDEDEYAKFINKEGKLNIVCKNKFYKIEITEGIMEAEFEEVKQSVDFMTAANSGNGKWYIED